MQRHFATLASGAAMVAAAATVWQEATEAETDIKKNRLLLSDLDGTLVGGPGDTSKSVKRLREFNKHWVQQEHPRGSILCYNTARCIKDYHNLLEAEKGKELLPPDVLVTGEGTEVRFNVNGSLELDQSWDQPLREVWFGENGLGVRSREASAPYDEGLVPGINDIDNSPPHGEMRHTISLRTEEDAFAACAVLRERLGPDAKVLVAAIGPEDTPIYLVTMLPVAAGKGAAALYVQETLGVSSSDCLCAGDTAGDAEMFHTGFRTITVANASPMLRKARLAAIQAQTAQDQQCKETGVSQSCHFLSNRDSAAGVLEGLLKFWSS